MGNYYSELYKRVVIACIDLWKSERLDDFDNFVIKQIKTQLDSTKSKITKTI